MNGNTYRVTQWGLPPKDQRLVEIVFRYARANCHRLQWSADGNGACDVLIIDAGRSDWAAALTACRGQHPDAIPISVSTDGQAGPGPYRIVRQHLLAHLLKVVDEALTIEIDHQGSRETVTDETRGQPRASAAGLATRGQATNGHALSAQGKFVAPRPTAPRFTALVVDDSVMVRAQVEAALALQGIRVIQADSAREAERVLVDRHAEVDFVLLDVVMPGVDGYQFCSALRRVVRLRRLPIIMLTSRSSPIDRARGALAGCDAFLTKPIAVAQLKEVIEKVLLRHGFNQFELAQKLRPLFHAA